MSIPKSPAGIEIQPDSIPISPLTREPHPPLSSHGPFTDWRIQAMGKVHELLDKMGTPRVDSPKETELLDRVKWLVEVEQNIKNAHRAQMKDANDALEAAGHPVMQKLIAEGASEQALTSVAIDERIRRLTKEREMARQTMREALSLLSDLDVANPAMLRSLNQAKILLQEQEPPPSSMRVDVRILDMQKTKALLSSLGGKLEDMDQRLTSVRDALGLAGISDIVEEEKELFGVKHLVTRHLDEAQCVRLLAEDRDVKRAGLANLRSELEDIGKQVGVFQGETAPDAVRRVLVEKDGELAAMAKTMRQLEQARDLLSGRLIEADGRLAQAGKLIDHWRIRYAVLAWGRKTAERYTEPHRDETCMVCSHPRHLMAGMEQKDPLERQQSYLDQLLKSQGAVAMIEERLRQITEEGRTADHDSRYTDDELTWMAIAYAAPSKVLRTDSNDMMTRDPFPFGPEWDKRGKLSRKRLLEMAGALLMADYDRIVALDKKAAAQGQAVPS